MDGRPAGRYETVDRDAKEVGELGRVRATTASQKASFGEGHDYGK